MKKSIVFKLALVAFALVFSVNASAGIIDGLLKPLLEQFNVTETTVQWSNVPVYSAQKVVETDADGKEGDIVSAYKLKMSLGKQKKLLKTYSQAFNDEGKPIAAKVDSKTLSDLGLTDAKTISQTTADLLKDLGGSDYTTNSVAALDDVDFSKLD